MAIPKCPNPECKSFSFEVNECQSVMHPPVKFRVINCAWCGYVVGALDYLPNNTVINAVIDEIKKS